METNRIDVTLRHATQRIISVFSEGEMKEVEKSFRKESNSCETKFEWCISSAPIKLVFCVSKKIDRHMKQVKTRIFSHFDLTTKNVFLMVDNFELLRSSDQVVNGTLRNSHRRLQW